jgi:hypothetical protein
MVSEATPEVRHPRTLAAFRTVLYAVVAVAVVGLVGVGLAVVGVGVVVAGLSLLLTGDANVFGLALLVAGGLVPVALAAVVGVGAHRLDRRVTAADRRPDPLAELQARYVAGELDEVTFEHRVERLLAGESLAGSAGGRLRRIRWLLAWVLARVVSRRRRRSPRAGRERAAEAELN